MRLFGSLSGQPAQARKRSFDFAHDRYSVGSSGHFGAEYTGLTLLCVT